MADTDTDTDIGCRVGRIGMGTAAFGGVYSGGVPFEQDVADAMVACALAGGVSHFDTAPFYASALSAEVVLGRALASSGAPRSSYTLTTKICRGRDAEGGSTHLTDELSMRNSLLASAAALGGHVDILLVHDIEFLDYDNLVQVVIPRLRAWRDAGGVGALGPHTRIGVCGYPLDLLAKAVRDTRVQVVQAYATATLLDDRLVSDSSDSGLLAAAAEVGALVLSASVTGMGLLTSSGPQPWHPLHAQPDAVQAVADGVAAAAAALAEHDTLSSLSLPDVALAQSLSLADASHIECTLLGPSTLAHLKGMLAVSAMVDTGTAAHAIAIAQQALAPIPKPLHW